MPNARRPTPSWPDRSQSGRTRAEGDREEPNSQMEPEPQARLRRTRSALQPGEELRDSHLDSLVQKPIVNLDPPTPPAQPLVVPHPASDSMVEGPVSPLKEGSPRLFQQ